MHQSAVPGRRTNSSTMGTGHAGRATWFVVATVALLIAVAGAGLRARSQAGEDPTTSGTGTLHGLTVTLHGAGWLGMDGHNMGDQGGFQMPAQMMPGAPEGDNMRLGIPLTLVNTDDSPRQFNLVEEFFLYGGRNEGPRPLHSDTFGLLSRLSPGSAVDGVLYFDTVVPGPGDPPLYLAWNREGGTIEFAVRIGGEAPHEHSPN